MSQRRAFHQNYLNGPEVATHFKRLKVLFNTELNQEFWESLLSKDAAQVNVAAFDINLVKDKITELKEHVKMLANQFAVNHFRTDWIDKDEAIERGL